MTTFTIPEEVIGIPLWVPTTNDFFTVEAAGMPNGDPALVVHGDVNDTYKAFMQAPVMSPVDVFNVGDMFAARQWSMSCWIKLNANLGVSGSGDVMLGCSTYNATGLFAGSRNLQAPLLLGPNATSGFQYFREVLNNVASPTSAQAILAANATGWSCFQSYWHMLVFNMQTVGSFDPQGSVMLDTYENAFGFDGSGGTSPSGSYGGPRYLHVGAYNNGGTGRADEWRLAKWAFHDHILSAAERLLMYQTMMGTVFIYSDDFNRADGSPGVLWQTVSGGAAWDILSNQARGFSNTSRYMTYVRDLTSADMYCEVDVINNPGQALARTRCQQGAAGFGGYSGGYSTTFATWRIDRNAVNVATVAGPVPTPPYRIRLETETIAGNVECRLYEIVAGIPTLRLSFTDSGGSKVLVGHNAGLALLSSVGTNQLADNWSAGML